MILMLLQRDCFSFSEQSHPIASCLSSFFEILDILRFEVLYNADFDGLRYSTSFFLVRLEFCILADQYWPPLKCVYVRSGKKADRDIWKSFWTSFPHKQKSRMNARYSEVNIPFAYASQKFTAFKTFHFKLSFCAVIRGQIYCNIL